MSKSKYGPAPNQIDIESAILVTRTFEFY